MNAEKPTNKQIFTILK